MTMIARRLLPALAVSALSSAEAASVITYNGNAAGGANSGGNFTIGTQFTVNATGLSITRLGVQDVDIANKTGGSDGFVVSGIQVGLWTNSGTLLAFATVASGDPLDGSYRYAVLTNAVTLDSTPVALTAGATYLLGAYVGNTGVGGRENWLDPFPGSVFAAGSGDITLGQNRYATGFNAPVNDGTGATGRWGAANAIIVPEPATALLGALGVLGLVRRRRA